MPGEARMTERLGAEMSDRLVLRAPYLILTGAGEDVLAGQRWRARPGLSVWCGQNRPRFCPDSVRGPTTSRSANQGIVLGIGFGQSGSDDLSSWIASARSRKASGDGPWSRASPTCCFTIDTARSIAPGLLRATAPWTNASAPAPDCVLAAATSCVESRSAVILARISGLSIPTNPGPPVVEQMF